MNTFPRNSLYLGHLISKLNQHYVCAEDGGNLVYACGDTVETLTCINHPEHQGLGENKEFLARERVYSGSSWIEYCGASLADTLLERAIQAKNSRIKIAMFGDDNA